jgi:predicted exporter
MNIMEITLIATILVLGLGIIYVTFLEILEEPRKKKVLISNKRKKRD